jgi:hypothetical protein
VRCKKENLLLVKTTAMSVDTIDLTNVPQGGFDIPPALNVKCIVLTAALSGAYWFLPHHNKYVLFGLLFFPYLFLSYYDVLYKAQRNMGPTYLADFYDWLKIPESKQIKVWKNWAPKWKTLIRIVDVVILVLVIALLPKLIEWNPESCDKEEESESNTKAGLFLAACLGICLYCRFFVKVSD